MSGKIVPVDSSMIKEVQYFQEDNYLIVKFHNDSIYGYEKVTPELFQKFIEAESKGKFFTANIKKLPTRKVYP